MTKEQNLISLELEKQLQEYANHLLTPTRIWNINDLEREVLKFLESYGYRGTDIDKLSSRFATIWALFYQSKKYVEADNCWDILLSFYDKWEKIKGIRVARGSPYYFRGMSAIAYGNLERGFLYFHQAMEEDFHEGFHPDNKNDWSPAWLFTTFNYTPNRQIARPLLKPRADWLNQILSKYRNSNRGYLTLELLQKKVLSIIELKEITFSFTYEIFRSENLLSYPKNLPYGSFSSQLSLDILFSFCRIVEVLLKRKQGKGMLKRQLTCFCKEHSIPLEKEDFGEIGNVDFDKSINSLLDSKQELLQKTYSAIESDLLLTYILRNEGGHTTNASLIIAKRFNELVERVLFGLFKIIETLY